LSFFIAFLIAFLFYLNFRILFCSYRPYQCSRYIYIRKIRLESLRIRINVFKCIRYGTLICVLYPHLYRTKEIIYVSPSSSAVASSSTDFFSRLLMALSTSLGCSPSFNLSLALTDGKFSEGHGIMPRLEFLLCDKPDCWPYFLLFISKSYILKLLCTILI